jgi:hypothetical protein
MSIDEQIKELEKQKQVLLKEEEQKKKQIKIDLNKSVIGKFYKRCSSYKYRDVVGNNTISYIRVIDYIRYSDGKIMYGEDSDNLSAEKFDIHYSPVGWKLVPDALNENIKRLAYTQGKNLVVLDTKKRYNEDNASIGGIYGITYFSPKKIDNGRVYDGHNWYEEVSLDEFYNAYNDALNFSEGFYHVVNKYFNNNYRETHESADIIEKLSTGALKRISDLIEKIDTKETNLHQLINSLSGKVRKYNYFNGHKLDELAQYSLSGELGLNLDIVGGDDGTDYEPYTTKYIINSVNIDWKMILYPIRTKLKSVLDTEKQLEQLKDVYNPHYWDCNYNTNGYDAIFNNAKLMFRQLEEVNDVIKNNLK